MASRDDLTDIIMKLTNCSSKADQVVLGWCKMNYSRCKGQAIGMELQNLWDDAQEIISEFNLYGGGPDSDEEEAADALWKMDEIVKKQDVSWDIRVAILISYIAPIYIEEKSEDELQRLYKLVMKTKWDVNICAIATKGKAKKEEEFYMLVE